MAMVLITHDLGVVAETCDRVVVMYGGIVAEQGSVADVYSQPTASVHKLLLEAFPDLDDPGAVAGVDPGKPAPARRDTRRLPLRPPVPVRLRPLPHRAAAELCARAPAGSRLLFAGARAR